MMLMFQRRMQQVLDRASAIVQYYSLLLSGPVPLTLFPTCRYWKIDQSSAQRTQQHQQQPRIQLLQVMKLPFNAGTSVS